MPTNNNGTEEVTVQLRKGNKMRKRRGFTLVELMIVVLILGALAAIAVPRIMGGAGAAKANGCKTNIDLINSQIELYYSTEGSWPATLDVVTTDTAYFPDGEPVCPATGAAYPNALTADHRVDASGHAH
jgi:prepilin-type N-terminal cleavage/methylation domain-containing protein